MKKNLTNRTNAARMNDEALQRAIETGVSAALKAMHLENLKADAVNISGGVTDMKQKKIRRPIIVDGEKRWINADSEQEYAEKCAQAFARGKMPESKQPERKHNFTEYARNWFEVFSKPNVEAVTAITYERQLKLHICPVLGKKT